MPDIFDQVASQPSQPTQATQASPQSSGSGDIFDKVASQPQEQQPEQQEPEQHSTIGNMLYGAGQAIKNSALGAIGSMAQSAMQSGKQVQNDISGGHYLDAAKDIFIGSNPGLQMASNAIHALPENAKNASNAYHDARQGDLASAWSNAIGSVPVIGPQLKEAGERLGNAMAGYLNPKTGKFETDSHELSGAVGEVAGIALSALTPRFAKAAPEAKAAMIEQAKSFTDKALDVYVGTNKLPPERLAMSALRGSASMNSAELVGSIRKSMPVLKRVAAETGTTDFSLDSLLGTEGKQGLIDRAKAANRQKFNELVGRNANRGTKINLSPVADSIEAQITPKMKLENPAQAKHLTQLAERYRQDFDIADVDSILKTTNAQLDSYYGENPAARGVDVRKNPKTAVLNAQATSLRKALYSYLDSDQFSGTAKELQKEWGSLNDFQESLYKRKNVMLRQAPLNVSSQISKWSSVGKIAGGVLNVATSPFSQNAAEKLATGASSIGAGLTQNAAAKFVQDAISTDSLLNKAFKNVNAGSEIKVAQPVKPKALLESGPRRMPSVPDNSGPIHGREPKVHNVQINPKQKALPAASKLPVKSEGLGSQAGDTTDLVPVSVGGKTVYMPKSLLNR